MKYALFLFIIFSACTYSEDEKKTGGNVLEKPIEKATISALLDTFHVAAANAEFDRYFSCFSKNGTFLGTDAKENWTKSEFMKWAKPYFEKRKTWAFTSLERNIYFPENGTDIAWFDELLKTQMKICRGSGVVVRENGQWKVGQYVLSMTFPNEKVKEAIQIKSGLEDTLIFKLEK